MKTSLLRSMALMAVIRLVPAALAATYYVSPSGSDAAAGTQAAPFATVQFGVGKLNPGDVLVLRAGDYHESVTVTQSGTSAAPILIQSYPGETAVLVGSRPVAGSWTVFAGSIYRASWPTQPVQVFCDGQLLNEARWPNTPLPGDLSAEVCASTDDGSTNDMVYANLPAVDLTGAWVQIMAGEAWVGYSRQITVHDRATGRLTFASPINQTSVLVPRRNNRFFVFGKLELLDAPGEWWWDPVGQQLYVWTPDGAAPASRVEAGTADSVLSLSGRSHVTVMGLGARGGWFNLQNCTACVVDDCNLVAPTWIRTFDGWTIWPTPYLGGVDVSGSGNVVQGGSVRLAGRSGVHMEGSDNTVRQILVADCGWNWTNNAAIDTVHCVRATVENCTILRASGTGLTMGPASRFLRNLVDTTSIDFEDNGDVGAWSMDGQGSEVAYNEIHGNHSRWGAGIYLDAGTKNFYVHDNYVHDVQWNGINITGPLRVEHNTFVAVQHQGLGVIPQSSTDGVDMSSGILAHNLAAEPFPIDVAIGQPLSLVPEGASFGTSTPLAPGPRRVEILCSQIVQPGWSVREVPLDLSVVNSVVFNFESPAKSYTYSIANLRLLPTGGTGDDGAVPVVGATVLAGASGGSTCTLSTSDAATWSVAGVSAYRGTNNLTVSLPSGLTDWRLYRGFAFELGGTATHDFDFQGYQNIDNGPDALPGRGATLPADVGAAAAGLGPIAPPTVSVQPASSSGEAGESVSFTVDASGNPAPTYQWQRLAAGSTEWTDLGEGGSYAGVLGATLTVNAPTAAMLGDQFRCVLTSATGSAISNAATLAASGASAVPAPMPIISEGVPAYCSDTSGTAANANSTDYDLSWRSYNTPTVAQPAWLAYDLSSKAPKQVVLTWYNPPSYDYDYAFYAGAASYNLPNNLPQDYTIDVNAAPGGSVPTSGWVTMVTVTGNVYHSRSAVFDMTGYNWVRINCTAIAGSAWNYNASCHLDVYDASNGTEDTWLFLGDSITAGGMNLTGTVFAQTVNASDGIHYPSQENGGMGGWTTGLMATDLSQFLSVSPAHYVTLSLGTNDINTYPGDAASIDSACNNLVSMANAVIAAGRIPIIPHVPWANTAAIQANAPLLNARIDALCAANPGILLGPDLFGYYNDNRNLISSDNVHPTSPAGFQAYRSYWAKWALWSVYAPVAVTEPVSQTVSSGQDASFTFSVSGEPSPAATTYQWYLNGTAIPSANQSTLVITGATPAASGYYTCTAMNSTGVKTSSTATLAVDGGVQPSNQTVALGGTVTFSVSGSGTPAPTYRWQVSTDGGSTWANLAETTPYGGSTTATLTLTGATTAMNGYQFHCVETNAGGITTTSAGTLVVETPLTVATLAGLAGTSGNSDGAGSVARFAGLSDVAVDSAGNLYVADSENNTLRKVTPTGIVTTLAGRAGVSGSSDGAGSATFNRPTGIAVDAGGNVYVADTNNNEIRKVTAAGAVSTLAGLAGVSGGNDGTGSAASFYGPSGIVADPTGNLYVADTLNHTIREVTPSGVVTTIAGLAGVSGFVDATGSAARFHGPQGLALSALGGLFVADTNNNAIREIVTSNGAVTTLAGQAGVVGNADGTNSQAQFYYPSGIAVDSIGNLYVADTDNHSLREITPLGAVSTLAGLAGSSGSADGVGSRARFNFPTGVAVDGAGDVYVADTNNDTVRVAFAPVAPVITQQPQSQTVTAGGSVQFPVNATGRPAVTYQWYFGSTAINGATGSTYTVSNAQSANAGGYSVVVTNSVGSTTSDTADLTVSESTPISTIPQGGGGGGGAPSEWFCGALLALAAARAFQRRKQ